MQSNPIVWGLSHTGIPDYKLYVIKVFKDDDFIGSQYFEYDNAVDAVNAYNKFVDMGDAKDKRVVNLIEPNEVAHTKVFYAKD